MISMEKIDYVISVTGADYNRVREALLTTDGDVDQAIQLIMSGESKEEEDYKHKATSRVEDINDAVNNFGEEIISAVKEIWDKGNATRLVVMDEKDTVILNVSMVIGGFFTIYVPLAALIGLGIGILNRYEFYVYLENGEAINVKDYITNKHRMR
ncbi:MAG: DUF4342 domain-containing protein [Tissierellia bacterium]|nr:DUF4342 domain-containing protein [Tissierellia bacterium]